jgi:BirA family biotin operon repressor/biotin-[acetyl-CoA-carboxylase] ligase
MPEQPIPKELSQALEGLALARVIYYDEIDSTNEQGLLLASQGIADSTLLVADKQTAGRGRFRRKWVTTPGTSLAFSLILQPNPAEAQHLSLFSLLGGEAVRRAVQTVCDKPALVKWPNDVLLDGRKTAGILAESAWQGGQLSGLVLGIGINILTGSVPPADELLYPATCLEEHCSNLPQRYDFLASVLQQIFSLRKEFATPLFMQQYNQHLAFKGQRVSLGGTAGETVSGILVDVDANGCLRLRNEDGTISSHPIGDLRLRKQ